MRRLKQLTQLIIATFLLSLISCSIDEDGDLSAPSGILKAKVDGVSFKSLKISSLAIVPNAGATTNLIIIASNSNGNAFAITNFGYTGERTYKFTCANTPVTHFATYSETNVYLSNPTVTTTELWQAPFNDAKVEINSITEETDT